MQSIGDLYGGAHYIQSGSATLLTLQGKAIVRAAETFGDGRTLPFTPCKKGYIPVAKIVDKKTGSVTFQRRYACPLHDDARRQRCNKNKNDSRPSFRSGEVNLTLFWERYDKDHHQILEPGIKESSCNENSTLPKYDAENSHENHSCS